MTSIQRIEQPTHLVPVPDIAPLKFGQRHVAIVDVIKNSRNFHAIPPVVPRALLSWLPGFKKCSPLVVHFTKEAGKLDSSVPLCSLKKKIGKQVLGGAFKSSRYLGQLLLSLKAHFSQEILLVSSQSDRTEWDQLLQGKPHEQRAGI